LLGRSPRQPGSALRALVAEMDGLRATEARLRGQLELLDRLPEAEVSAAGRLAADPPHAHLQHRAQPLGSDADSSRLLRVWSAASASVVLAVLGSVLILRDSGVIVPFLVVAAVMIVVEATMRRRLLSLVAGLVVLALGAVALWAVAEVVVGNLRNGFGVLLLLAAGYMAVQTVQEGLRTRE
jgi:hypothetical protein